MPPERVRLWAEYSSARDVLFVSVRPVRHALAEPATTDSFWLRDADTAEIVGFECPFFSRNVRDRDWLRSLPAEPTFTVEAPSPHGAWLTSCRNYGGFWRSATGPRWLWGSCPGDARFGPNLLSRPS